MSVRSFDEAMLLQPFASPNLLLPNHPTTVHSECPLLRAHHLVPTIMQPPPTPPNPPRLSDPAPSDVSDCKRRADFRVQWLRHRRHGRQGVLRHRQRSTLRRPVPDAGDRLPEGAVA